MLGGIVTDAMFTFFLAYQVYTYYMRISRSVNRYRITLAALILVRINRGCAYNLNFRRGMVRLTTTFIVSRNAVWS